MLKDLAGLSGNQIYHLMTQTVIPRPVAWILTKNKDDGYNIAPYSYFMAISNDPPLVMVSVGKKDSSTRKDTAVNIEKHKEMVIHIPSVSQASEVTESAKTLAYGDSELSLFEHELIEVPGWNLPRVKESPVAYYATWFETHKLGNNNQNVIYCELHSLYVSPQAVTQTEVDGVENTRISALSVNPLCRLGASEYAGLDRVFKVSRPK